MANHISHAALPYPIKGARFTLGVPYLDADGDPTDPTTPDTEFSLDAGAYADTAEEVTTITGSNGSGYLTLSGAETNGSLLFVCAKVASGPKATLFTGYPRVLPVLASGTLDAGSASGGTLSEAIGYDLRGCIIKTTGGTGGGGTGGASNQARVIITSTPSTGAFTVSPNFETAVSTDTTVEILITEMAPNAILTPTAAALIADVSRRRTQANVEASLFGDTLNKSSLYGLIQQAQNSGPVAAGSLPIRKTDNTALSSITVDSGSADPIISTGTP